MSERKPGLRRRSPKEMIHKLTTSDGPIFIERMQNGYIRVNAPKSIPIESGYLIQETLTKQVNHGSIDGSECAG